MHGATILEVVVSPFDPQGVTGVAVLAESHLAIHTWPELGYAAIDAFTCGRTDALGLCQEVARRLEAQDTQATEVPRGRRAHGDVELDLKPSNQERST